MPQPSFRCDTVEPGGAEQRVDPGGSFAPAVGAGRSRLRRQVMTSRKARFAAELSISIRP